MSFILFSPVELTSIFVYIDVSSNGALIAGKTVMHEA